MTLGRGRSGVPSVGESGRRSSGCLKRRLVLLRVRRSRTRRLLRLVLLLLLELLLALKLLLTLLFLLLLLLTTVRLCHLVVSDASIWSEGESDRLSLTWSWRRLSWRDVARPRRGRWGRLTRRDLLLLVRSRGGLTRRRLLPLISIGSWRGRSSGRGERLRTRTSTSCSDSDESSSSGRRTPRGVSSLRRRSRTSSLRSPRHSRRRRVLPRVRARLAWEGLLVPREDGFDWERRRRLNGRLHEGWGGSSSLSWRVWTRRRVLSDDGFGGLTVIDRPTRPSIEVCLRLSESC